MVKRCIYFLITMFFVMAYAVLNGVIDHMDGVMRLDEFAGGHLLVIDLFWWQAKARIALVMGVSYFTLALVLSLLIWSPYLVYLKNKKQR